jgi:hypothetical protein
MNQKEQNKERTETNENKTSKDKIEDESHGEKSVTTESTAQLPKNSKKKKIAKTNKDKKKSI